MFSKVANRVRRRSVGQKPSMLPVQRQNVLQVDIAPELLRFSDFSTPFPSVSVGGYTRFYTTYTTISQSMEPLNFCPILSQRPEPSPSSEIPQKFPLFNNLQRSCLPMIREASMESLHKPRKLTITTSTPPHSLKRRQRRLLRTPSVERDFNHVHGSCQSPSDTSTTIGEPGADTDVAPSPCSTLSSDSQLSRAQSDSNHSEGPLTPSTSVNGEDDGERLSTELADKLEPHHELDPVMIRAISTISFSTAKTEFSEI